MVLCRMRLGLNLTPPSLTEVTRSPSLTPIAGCLPADSKIKQARQQLKEALGKHGLGSLKREQRRGETKFQNFSFSFIAAISQAKVISTQILEGGVSSVVFENFVYHTLRHLRTSRDTKDKDIVLLMDNAVIHKHSIVLETARKFRVNVLFNAEYSPWLNPVEKLFDSLKRRVKAQIIHTK